MTPTLRRLLPIEIGTELTEKKEEIDKTEQNTLMNYEPDEEAVLDAIIPKYVTSLIYGGITESAASENGARMQAMDSASKQCRGDDGKACSCSTTGQDRVLSHRS